MSSNTTQKENHSTAHIENPQKHEEKPNDTSIISLPDNQDQAAEVYISNLLDRVKNHISAST
jgi:Golgi nucleoside diphosphatase